MKYAMFNVFAKGLKGLNYILLITMVLGFAFLFVGCEEIIEFDSRNRGGELVIFGRVTNIKEGNSVSVSLTGPFNRPPSPISFAEVVIYDEVGNREVFVESNERGVYRPAKIILDRSIGRTFFLEVCTPDGKKYRSVVEAIPESIAQDSVYFTVETERFVTSNDLEVRQTVIDVLLDSKIEREDNKPVFFRWEVEEVYSIQEVILPSSKFPLWGWKTCYITNPVDAQKFYLFDGLELNSDQITNFSLAKRPLDGTFAANHYFNVNRYALSFESFDYWKKVNQLTDRVGSIFDSPPATLPSNIINVEDPDEIVFGHFEVVSSSTSRFLVTKNDIPVIFDAPCEVPPEIADIPANCFSCLQEIFALKQECLNCLTLKNSSLIRPDYF